MMPDCSEGRWLSVDCGESANRGFATMARRANRLAEMSVFMGYALDVPNAQLTDGGPFVTSELPTAAAGPPFGAVPFAAISQSGEYSFFVTFPCSRVTIMPSQFGSRDVSGSIMKPRLSGVCSILGR